MKAARIAAIAAGLFAAACAPAGASIAHVVQPGETLSGIAAANGIGTSDLAAANGISPSALVISGSTIQVPTGAASTPAPTSSVGASEVSTIAAQQGVSGSLAAAIGWQESGFNNAMVSGASASGVMQMTPAAWQYVEQSLGVSLDPSSAQDNVRAGSLYLAQLLRETGGDERMAVAAYYQGLTSVRTIGVLPETQRYVDDVMALRARFGG